MGLFDSIRLHSLIRKRRRRARRLGFSFLEERWMLSASELEVTPLDFCHVETANVAHWETPSDAASDHDLHSVEHNHADRFGNEVHFSSEYKAYLICHFYISIYRPLYRKIINSLNLFYWENSFHNELRTKSDETFIAKCRQVTINCVFICK